MVDVRFQDFWGRKMLRHQETIFMYKDIGLLDLQLGILDVANQIQ
jgi:hypothetical protein